jgi:hypothetical protein
MLLGVALLLAIVACGTYLFVRRGVIRKCYKQLLKKPRCGVLGKYAQLVTSADKGAVLLYE